MVLKIDKKYFENLAIGEHTLKVNFKDGFAEGTFEVKDKITFSILGVPCEATVGMSWYDWFCSSGSTSGNSYIMTAPSDNKLYINHKAGQFDHVSGIASLDKTVAPYIFQELTLHEEGSATQQGLFDQIKNGAKYGRLNTGGADAPE